MTMTKKTRDDFITIVYEKYANGEISENQRELLIQKANSCIDLDSLNVVNEKTEEPKKQKKLSPKEKYDMFKKAVYKKCEDGEITEDFREELLEKARDEFLPDQE